MFGVIWVILTFIFSKTGQMYLGYTPDFCVRVYVYVRVPEQVFSGDEKSQIVGQPLLHESQTQPSPGPS